METAKTSAEMNVQWPQVRKKTDLIVGVLRRHNATEFFNFETAGCYSNVRRTSFVDRSASGKVILGSHLLPGRHKPDLEGAVTIADPLHSEFLSRVENLADAFLGFNPRPLVLVFAHATIPLRTLNAAPGKELPETTALS